MRGGEPPGRRPLGQAGPQGPGRPLGRTPAPPASEGPGGSHNCTISSQAFNQVAFCTALQAPVSVAVGHGERRPSGGRGRSGVTSPLGMPGSGRLARSPASRMGAVGKAGRTWRVLDHSTTGGNRAPLTPPW